jgi:cation-transporting ATPase 13A1
MSMIVDFAGCWAIETLCKALFANLEPGEMVSRGSKRREKRRAEQEREKLRIGTTAAEKKVQ